MTSSRNRARRVRMDNECSASPHVSLEPKEGSFDRGDLGVKGRLLGS
jgi:hypothetical protein